VDILRDQPLRDLNTFGLPAVARWFVRASSPADLLECLDFARGNGLPVLPLGGGSNLVLAGDPPGLVLQVGLPGFDVAAAGLQGVLVRVGAGEDWSGIVDRCLGLGLYGLENLVLIPGTAGAAPIQNIGAYGVEVRSLLTCVEAVDITTGRVRTFDNDACAFGYRDSVFKGDLKDRFVVAAVTMRLSREPVVKASYGALATELSRRGVAQPTPIDVAEAVRHLRRTKLPDPAVTGNAGSFFQNPLVDGETAEALRSAHPGLPTFPSEDGRVKLAAAWLIEQCGFKGARRGAAGVHPSHALVLVNHGGATGRDILALADEIRSAVLGRFGIFLAIEPRVIG
jgi:UDP-N-acetylmuramate dehydrogenase